MAPFKALIIFTISINCFSKGVWCDYVTNSFKVHSDSEIVAIPGGEVTDAKRDVYVVLNLGVVPVWVVTQTKSWLHGDYYDESAIFLEPLSQEHVPISTTESPYFYRLVIRNREDTGAIVYAAVNDKYEPVKKRNGGSNYLNINTNLLLKSIATFGAGYIPVVGGALSAILDFFWPVAVPDVWSQVSDKVEAMIGEKNIELVSNLLSSKVRRFSRRLQGLNMEIKMREENESKIHIANHFLNLAQDMFGLEEDFLFDRFSPKTKKMNFQLLPYYVKVVSLQVEVYNFGITHQKLLGLEPASVRSVKMYRDATLFTRHTGAVDYIHTLYSEHQKMVFDECPDPEEIYNCMANVRNYLTMNGLDYINRWSQPLVEQEQKNTTYACNPLFSKYLGRPSYQVHAVGCRQYIPKFLKTEYFNGRCSRMVMVKFFACGHVFCGMKTFFEDGKVHMMGQEGESVADMELKTRTIRKIEAFATNLGSLSGLLITFTNGKQAGAGFEGDPLGTFEMEGYYISAIMASHGDRYVAGSLANFAVAYLQDGH